MTTAAAQRKCSSRVACRSLCYRTPDPSDPPLPLAASLLRTLLLLSAGPLPSSWSALSKLQGLDLSHNALDSTLPGNWSALANLQALDLSSNNFTGSVPASWSGMTALNAVSFANNPGVCSAGNSTKPGVNSTLIYYSPCDAYSPPLPGISPDYPNPAQVPVSGVYVCA